MPNLFLYMSSVTSLCHFRENVLLDELHKLTLNLQHHTKRQITGSAGVLKIVCFFVSLSRWNKDIKCQLLSQTGFREGENQS